MDSIAAIVECKLKAKQGRLIFLPVIKHCGAVGQKNLDWIGQRTREAGGSVKPGVERSGTPGHSHRLKTERAERATVQFWAFTILAALN